MSNVIQRFMQRRPANPGDVPTEYSTTKPGLLLVLIDQSTSMNEKWGGTGMSRKDGAAEHVNRMINRILNDSQNGNVYKDRIWMAICGYSLFDEVGNAFRVLKEGWPSAFSNQTGWVVPVANGRTPMTLAFQGARQYLEAFFDDSERWDQFKQSTPPIILNVTDGEANEFDDDDWQSLSDEVERIWRLKTPQSFSPLVFHVHLSGTGGDHQSRRMALPTEPAGLDRFGQNLFRLASQVPDSWVRSSSMQERPISAGAVGLITNASPADLMDILTVVSRSRSATPQP